MNTQGGTILDSELRDAGGGGYLGEGFCENDYLHCNELELFLFW